MKLNFTDPVYLKMFDKYLGPKQVYMLCMTSSGYAQAFVTNTAWLTAVPKWQNADRTLTATEC